MSFNTLPTFDLGDIPFSYRGSWLNLSPVVGLHQRSEHIHLVSHVTGMHPVLSLVPSLAGTQLQASVSADPTALTWDCGINGTVRAAFESTRVLRVAGEGVDLQITDAAPGLTPFTGTYFFVDPLDGAHVFTSYETGRRYRITALRGTLVATGAEALGSHDRALTVSGDSGWEIAIEELDASAVPYSPTGTFDEVVARAASTFERFLDAIAEWRSDAVPAVALAAYVLWSATVSPAGFLTRESILMSKHWMDKVWSWDHSFNALAVASGDVDLALDQFHAPFDHQDESGAMPDSITHSEVLYNFVKPPIHGWAFRKLRQRAARALSHEELSVAYDRLSKWTRFWTDSRTAPGRELPFYQHGNDSGWDNSTTFDYDRVIEAPDLAAFLVVQLDVLGDLADALGVGEGDAWRAERDRIRAALLDQLCDEEGFFAVGAHSGRASKRTSLLNLLPVLAASHLPDDVNQTLARGIEAHLTSWGPATQLLDSPEYESDGYWRGPIWAPSTMLIEDGLRTAGFVELADDVSARFRALCERSGFAENFDAVTGEGLRDRAYTWTASVYLLFAQDAQLRVRRNSRLG